MACPCGPTFSWSVPNPLTNANKAVCSMLFPHKHRETLCLEKRDKEGRKERTKKAKNSSVDGINWPSLSLSLFVKCSFPLNFYMQQSNRFFKTQTCFSISSKRMDIRISQIRFWNVRY